MDRYQATNCTAVRDKAQSEVEDLMLTFYHANLAWGIVLILVVSLRFKLHCMLATRFLC
jgi:hypothetical protein